MTSESSDDKKEHHPLLKTSRLSHVMLKVPSVDRTVAYWTEKMGSVLVSKHDDQGSMMSAFVALGNGTSTESSFALELVQTSDDKFQLGNALSYIGVSMLLQFSNNLVAAAAGEKPQAQGDEPNAIQVKSSASAPGDYFCRFCLKTNDLVATNEFYMQVLGMDAKAIDADMICMRYDGAENTGVPTTLVFEKTEEDLDMGNCFDHIAIVTSQDIGEQYERIRTMIADEATTATIFMNPTDMFGKRVMGVRDPNGYKVVLASE